MLEKIKERFMKPSQRGVYLQDRELLETSFQPGTNFSYIIDVAKKQLRIVPADNGNTVSKRSMGSIEKSVIDIRAKEVLELFKDEESIKIAIYESYILLEAVSETIGTQDCETKPTYRLDIKEMNQLPNAPHMNHIRNQVGMMLRNIPNGRLKKSLGLLDIPLQFASLFSGAGIMDKGMMMEGFEPKVAVEIDKHACKTYQANIGDHILNEDVWNVKFEAMESIPIVIGGSPCQNYSLENQRTRFWDAPNNQLVYRFVEAVKALKSKIFVLENVPGILRAGNGHYIDYLQAELPEHEFTVALYNSADFGSPQERKRAIIIGSTIGRVEELKPTCFQYRTVSEAFKNLDEDCPNQQDYSKPDPATIERMSYVPIGGNIRDIPIELAPKGGHSNSYKRLNPNLPAPTVVNVRKANIMSYIKNRILTVRECARLFDVPDDFIFHGPLSSKQQQVCNAVPINLVRAIAKEIKATINRYYEKQIGGLLGI